MTILEYLIKAIQDDARRAGERDRLRREVRRARKARRVGGASERPGPEADVSALAGRDAAGSGGAAQDGGAFFRGEVLAGFEQTGQQFGLGSEGAEYPADGDCVPRPADDLDAVPGLISPGTITRR